MPPAAASIVDSPQKKGPSSEVALQDFGSTKLQTVILPPYEVPQALRDWLSPDARTCETQGSAHFRTLTKSPQRSWRVLGRHATKS
jgi:hypothetical protein